MIGKMRTDQRRNAFHLAIATPGGGYITASDNHQPIPELQIASIHHQGITGIGETERQAQNDWIANWRKTFPAFGNRVFDQLLKETKI